MLQNHNKLQKIASNESPCQNQSSKYHGSGEFTTQAEINSTYDHSQWTPQQQSIAKAEHSLMSPSWGWISAKSFADCCQYGPVPISSGMEIELGPDVHHRRKYRVHYKCVFMTKKKAEKYVQGKNIEEGL